MKKISAILLALLLLLPAASLAGEPPFFETFGDAVKKGGESAAFNCDLDFIALAMETDGQYYRAVTFPDDRARELFMTALETEDNGETYEAFEKYAWSLPVCYTEELTQKPKEQAELDALDGLTVAEILEKGYVYAGSGGSIFDPPVIDLSYGLFCYEFTAEATFEEYLQASEKEDFGDLRVKGGKLYGFSNVAADPDCLADGTYQPRFVPHITAGEAEAAKAIPPADEYTAKAWPLDREGYSHLLKNLDNSYGQVYMVKGTVRQVLSADPLRLVICTAEDGKTSPVIIECPTQPKDILKEGTTCRIYADVTSACYILPVLTARYIYTE